jgi:hypothetical protein
VWKRHLGTPSPSSQRPCGNINPLGITGTPIYYPGNGLVYVAAEFGASPPVPTAREAGIWTPPGPTVAGDGSLFVAVGNGGRRCTAAGSSGRSTPAAALCVASISATDRVTCRLRWGP